MICDKGTYRSRTRHGPPRATELSAVGQGCSNTMVGAWLSLLRSSAARKKKRKWFRLGVAVA